MRFILTLAMMPILGLAFQNCSKSNTTTTNNPVQTNTIPANNAVLVNENNAVPAPEQHSDDAPRITLEEAKKDFDKGNVLFIDTRPAAAYNVEHIKGAINIPADAVEAHYSEIPKSKKVIAYCS